MKRAVILQNEEVRAVILARDMPTEPDLHPCQLSSINHKGYKNSGAYKNVSTDGRQYNRYIPRTYSVGG